MDKPIVNNFIMDDMKKYIPGLNPEDYEVTTGYTSPNVVAYARNYYDRHLPVDFEAWNRVNDPDENLVYGNLYKDYHIISDTISTIIFPDHEEWENNKPMVVFVIPSLSGDYGRKIPTIRLNLKECGGYILFSYNAAFWIITIVSTKPLDFVVPELFVSDGSTSTCDNVFLGSHFGSSYEDNYYKYLIGIGDSENLEEFIKFFMAKLK